MMIRKCALEGNMKKDLIDKVVLLSVDWLKSEITDSIAAITVGFDPDGKTLKYLLYYLKEENKSRDIEIVDEISSEVYTHIWNQVNKIEIGSEFYTRGEDLKKLDEWIYVKEGISVHTK